MLNTMYFWSDNIFKICFRNVISKQLCVDDFCSITSCTSLWSINKSSIFLCCAQNETWNKLTYNISKYVDRTRKSFLLWMIKCPLHVHFWSCTVFLKSYYLKNCLYLAILRLIKFEVKLTWKLFLLWYDLFSVIR